MMWFLLVVALNMCLSLRIVLNLIHISHKTILYQASEANVVVDYKDWQIPLGRRFRFA